MKKEKKRSLRRERDDYTKGLKNESISKVGIIVKIQRRRKVHNGG